jgi:hypothetical protein
MSKSQIRKEIAALINSIKEHSDNIGEKEHIPQLELELILHKIEKLYQKSIVFNHLNSLPRASLQKEEEESKTEVKSLKKEEAPREVIKPVDLFGTEVDPSEKPKVEKKTEKEVKKEVKPLQIHKPSIADLRSAIGINDKFQFMNELFAGNMQEYEIAVQQLNTAETLESAVEYFMNIQQLYNWNNDDETVKRLFELVERRYS